MPTQEIKETNWDRFCKRVEDAHRGVLITLEIVNHNGSTQEIAKDLPLKEFAFQRTQGCSDTIKVTLGESQTIQHTITEPIHVRLREADGAKKILQIDAESGSVELRFSSGKIGALLKDLEA